MGVKNKPILKLGDCVALISPAGKIERQKIQKSKKALQELGLFVVEYPKKIKKDSFFSSSDEDRAKELSWAFSDSAIQAVFCCRGGYGSSRSLRQVSDKDLKQWQEKIFVGYSDITYIHHWMFNRFGWKGFHGPLVGHLEKTHLKKLTKDLMSWSDKKSETWSEIQILQKGSAKGRLMGGNLSLFQTSGPAALPKTDMILVIEEVNESYYRIDRSLQNLIDAGYQKYIKAVIVGGLQGCGKADARSFGLKRLKESFRSLTKGPVWWGGSFGHGRKTQRLIRIGAKVKMQAKKLHYIDG